MLKKLIEWIRIGLWFIFAIVAFIVSIPLCLIALAILVVLFIGCCGIALIMMLFGKWEWLD